jgi:aromatic-L-amino-acid decarboxylase
MIDGIPLPGNGTRDLITVPADSHPRSADLPGVGMSLEPDRATMQRIGRQAVDYIAELHDRSRTVISRADAVDVRAVCAALLSPPPSGPTDFPTVLDTIATALSAGVPTISSTAFDHIPTGALYTSAVAGFLAQGMNPFTGTPAVAPELVAMEHSVLAWLCREFDLPDTAGGVITSGGSLAALTAVVAARHERLGERIATGSLYVTARTHHSVLKAARIAGLPTTAVRVVPTDRDLRMDLHAAEAMIRMDRAVGWRPFLIIGTAGSTDTGTIDPLDGIATLAGRYGLWLHVDAAFGGAFQLTRRGRERLAGIERADSIAIDPHKGFSTPYGLGVLLVARTKSLRATYTGTGAYLPDGDDRELPDYSTLGLELTREFRGLRLWLPLHVHGTDAFRASLNEKLDLAQTAYDDLVADPYLDLPWTPDLSVVAFQPRTGDTGRFLERIHATSDVRLSATRVAGQDLIRLCVLSHRSHAEHVDQALHAIHLAARSGPLTG